MKTGKEDSYYAGSEVEIALMREASAAILESPHEPARHVARAMAILPPANVAPAMTSEDRNALSRMHTTDAEHAAMMRASLEIGA